MKNILLFALIFFCFACQKTSPGAVSQPTSVNTGGTDTGGTNTVGSFYRAGFIMDFVQLPQFESQPFGARDFDSLNDIYAYVDNLKFARSGSKRYGLPELPRTNPKPVASLCYYELQTLQHLIVKTFSPDGAKSLDTWDSDKDIEFTQMVEYQRKPGDLISVKFIGPESQDPHDKTVNLAHLYYWRDKLIFIEMYKAQHNLQNQNWDNLSLSDFYIFCLNRSSL